MFPIHLPTQVGRPILVKLLRESDVYGAPLLFQAASSSNLKCFVAVTKVICRTLGLGELRQQLLAKDLKNRTILFHAATTKTVDVFNEVVNMLDMANKGEEDDENYSWLTVKNGSELLERDERQEIGTRIIARDVRGMNILHHACRAGSAEVLNRILTEAKQQGQDFVKGYLRTSDNRGRTPLFHVLRAYDKTREDKFFCRHLKRVISVSEGNAQSEHQIQEDQFKEPEGMERNKILSQQKSTETTRKLTFLVDWEKQNVTGSAWKALTTSAWGKTAIVFAAHGGVDQLNIFRRKLFEVVPREKLRDDGGLNLEDVLGEPGDELRSRCHGNLLVGAALSGDKRVLEYAVWAIEVRRVFCLSPFSLTQSMC